MKAGVGKESGDSSAIGQITFRSFALVALFSAAFFLMVCNSRLSCMFSCELRAHLGHQGHLGHLACGSINTGARNPGIRQFLQISCPQLLMETKHFLQLRPLRSAWFLFVCRHHGTQRPLVWRLAKPSLVGVVWAAACLASISARIRHMDGGFLLG